LLRSQAPGARAAHGCVGWAGDLGAPAVVEVQRGRGGDVHPGVGPGRIGRHAHRRAAHNLPHEAQGVAADVEQRAAAQLKLPELTETALAELRWGLIPDGHTVGKPEPVFPRIIPGAVPPDSQGKP
jgi:hypothetical protein